MDWFLYDKDLYHKKVKEKRRCLRSVISYKKNLEIQGWNDLSTIKKEAVKREEQFNPIVIYGV